jgi:alpha-beta hydrolase superfamily lysophospholipase
MMNTLKAAAVLAVILLGAGWWQAPQIAAGALLYPMRRPVTGPPPEGCRDETIDGEGVRLSAWRCPAAETRGTLVYLHGIADNRAAAAGLVGRYRTRGLDVIAYDSRGHGNSTGEICTYGHFEKADLRRVIDTAARPPILLVGASLGGAVALQAAADDPRIAAVVAIDVFSDLRTVARERAPFVLTDRLIDDAFAIAGARGGFRIADIDVAAAARRVRQPVLLIHGADDRETRPDHSQRVYAALAGPRELLLVPGAGHNQALSSADVWTRIDTWLLGHLQDSAPPIQ